MAKGGWSYVGYQANPHVESTAEIQASIDGFGNAVKLLPGWGDHTAPYRFATDSQGGCWWGAWEHTSGAILVAAWNYGDSPTLITGANEQRGQTWSGYNSRWSMAFTYLPPGNSGFGAASPDIAGFIPNDGFKFSWVGYDDVDNRMAFYDAWNGTYGSNTFHLIGKGDDLYILIEVRSDASRTFDYFFGFGTLIGELAHPTQETNANRAKECYLGMLDGLGGLNSGDSPMSFFRTPTQGDGTTSPPRVRSDGAWLTWASTGIAASVHDYSTVGDEVWVPPILYYSRTSDIDAEGVIRGNGMKGVLDPEKIMIVQGTGLSPRQTLDGGNFVYIGGNVAIGWDPGNGPMI